MKRDWWCLQIVLPYYKDEDYRKSMISLVRLKFGDVTIDVTFLEYCGQLEVESTQDEMYMLFGMDNRFIIKHTCDRGMIKESDRKYI